MTCRLLTAAYVHTGGHPDIARSYWPGPGIDKPPAVCHYEAPDVNALICHWIVTHRMSLAEARRVPLEMIG